MTYPSNVQVADENKIPSHFPKIPRPSVTENTKCQQQQHLSPTCSEFGVSDDEVSISSGDGSNSEGLPAELGALLGHADEVPAPFIELARKEQGLQFLLGSEDDKIDAQAVSIIGQHFTLGLEESFYVIDLATVYRRWRTWGLVMPRVKPHYAVKCNPDRAILALLARLGTGFDCASAKEIEMVTRLGVDPSTRVIFANPTKMIKHVRHAASVGCDLTTFDTVSELHKLAQHYPACRLVLRIRADDPDARCQLGNKFGAEAEDVPLLLDTAKELGLNVVGVSFHVGSGATNPAAFTLAIRSAREAFDAAIARGFEPRLLDIGGGFSGGQGVDGLAVVPVAAAVNAALDECFPSPDVEVIAEPGRFFAEACGTLVSNVYGKREKSESGHRDYWISDGIYGSMNCLLYDHAELNPRVLARPGLKTSGKKHVSTIFGPTCDGLDTVLTDVELPELEIGDWILFPCMGAYTMAAGSDFNGFNITDMLKSYVWSCVPPLDMAVDVWARVPPFDKAVAAQGAG